MHTITTPTYDELRQALINQAHNVVSFAAAAMHLASPTSALIGPDIFREDGVWHYRGKTVPVAEDLDGAVQAAVELMAMTVVPSDMFIDLTTPVGQWVKIGRSGERKVAFGLPLLGGPALVSDAQYSDQLIKVVADAALNGNVDEFNCIFTDGDKTAFAKVDSELISLMPGSDWQ